MLRKISILIIWSIAIMANASPKYAHLEGLSPVGRQGALILDDFSNHTPERLETALNLIRSEAQSGNAASNYILGVIYSQEANRYGRFFSIIHDEYDMYYCDPRVEMSTAEEYETYAITDLEGYPIHKEEKTFSDYKNESAIYHYTIAADMGYAAAMNNLGYLYSQYQSQEYRSKALQYYLDAIKSGCPEAYSNLGREYFYGRNIVSLDYSKAVEYLTKGVELGDNTDETLLLLGYCYENGLGIAQDYKKAIEIYTLASDNSSILNIMGACVGNFSIPARLAILYYSIDEVRDYDQAFRYLKAVADQFVQQVGEVRGYILRCLSACYRFGRGTSVDIAKADYYMQEAGKFGNIDARKALEYLSE